MRNPTPVRLSNGDRFEDDKRKPESERLYKNNDPLYNFIYQNNLNIWNHFKDCLDTDQQKIIIINSPDEPENIGKPLR